MKILILLRDLSLNGISTYNRNLANELSLQGHEVHVWPSNAAIASRSRLRWPILHPWAERLVRHFVQWINPDVILVSHFTQARLAHKLKQSTGIPWVACMHNGHSPQRMAEWAQLFSNAAGVVTLCETMREQYSKLLASSVQAGKPLAPVLLSRLPIAIPEPRQRRSDAPLKLAYCSRLSGGKGPLCEAWLQAVAALPGHERYKLLVMGGGNYLRTLRKTATELGLNVEFTGSIRDPGQRLNQVDVLTGSGYALMEGMVRGCAPVALGFAGCFGALTDVNLADAFAVNFGDHCLELLPKDAGTVARELQLAINSADDTASIRQRSIERFSPEPIVAELVAFLQQVKTA